jgi:hypothetical protein
MIAFSVSVHDGVALPPSDGARGVHEVVVLHVFRKFDHGLSKDIHRKLRFEIETGQHVKHIESSALSSVRDKPHPTLHHLRGDTLKTPLCRIAAELNCRTLLCGRPALRQKS